MFRRQKPSPPVPGATAVRRRPAIDFSVTGVVYVAMMLFMGLAAINSQANLLFGMFGLMIGILLVSGIISRLVLKRLQIRRSFPENGAVGHPLTLVYQITNAKRFWPSLSVSVAELDGVEAFTTQPQAYMLHVAPGMTAAVPAIVIPKRRGLHELGEYQVSTSFPFGFVKRAITERRKDVILIYPPAARVDSKLLGMCRSNDLTGESARPSPGGSDEFYGVKEFRTGDNPRWIYWRRSARSGTLVSKEMAQMSPPRVLLLVDTYLITGRPDERAAVERCIAMAASLATVALEQGLSVGLVAWSGEWVTVAPTRGKRHRDDMLSLLSRLSRNTAHGISELMEHSQSVLHAGTTPIVFTPRDTQNRPTSASRGGMLVITADSTRARSWFRFDDEIDFTTCMPPEEGDAETRRHGDAETDKQILETSGTGGPVPASPRLRVPASFH
jgi:uncharacterized protein (DUF58 family)